MGPPTISDRTIKKNVPRVDRLCLGCGRMFPSSGPGNRRCNRCDAIVGRVGDLMEFRYKEKRVREDIPSSPESDQPIEAV
jgi:hypothetical protein